MFEHLRKAASGIFGANALQKLALPAGMPGGETGITLQGRSCVEIDGCRGLTEYADERIAMKIREGTLEVCGGGLQLKIYHGARVAVCGRIDALRFYGEGGK